MRMVLGSDGRQSAKRSAPKLVGLFVDPDETVFDAFMALMEGPKTSSPGSSQPFHARKMAANTPQL